MPNKDNFNFNEDTSVITYQTPKSPQHNCQHIPRKKYSAAEVIEPGIFPDLVKAYSPPVKSPVKADMRLKPINPVTIDVKKHDLLDTMWICSSLSLPTRAPGWQGLMSKVMVEKGFGCTSVT